MKLVSIIVSGYRQLANLYWQLPNRAMNSQVINFLRTIDLLVCFSADSSIIDPTKGPGTLIIPKCLLTKDIFGTWKTDILEAREMGNFESEVIYYLYGQATHKTHNRSLLVT